MVKLDGLRDKVLGESILNSVKKLLGILPEQEEFDPDIIMNINAALFTLRQIGVGPSEGYTIFSADETFEDFLGEGNEEISQVKMYLYYKTKLGFDPPQSSYMIELLKDMAKEAEWRLNVQVDPRSTFEEEVDV